MDVYSLINSKDIAEYLREIHYEFNSLETARLIWKNDYLTFDEKKEEVARSDRDDARLRGVGA